MISCNRALWSDNLFVPEVGFRPDDLRLIPLRNLHSAAVARRLLSSGRATAAAEGRCRCRSCPWATGRARLVGRGPASPARAAPPAQWRFAAAAARWRFSVKLDPAWLPVGGLKRHQPVLPMSLKLCSYIIYKCKLFKQVFFTKFLMPNCDYFSRRKK